MISLNSVINFLNERGHKRITDYERIPLFELKKDVKLPDMKSLSVYIDEENESTQEVIPQKSVKSLPQSFSIIFDTKELSQFYIDNRSSRMCKNKSSIFTFINSIFMIIYPEFVLLNESQREENIKSFLKKISDELFMNNLYHKFLYPTNRRMNKSELQEILAKSFTFKYEEEFVPLLQQYIADYFGLNIFVFSYSNGNIDFINSYNLLASYFKVKQNPLVPTIIIIKDNDIYKGMISNDDNSYILYSTHRSIIDNLWKYFKLNNINECIEDLKVVAEPIPTSTVIGSIDMSMMRKLKVDELKEVCIKYNINLKKISEKTGKEINKIKSELLEDLEKL